MESRTEARRAIDAGLVRVGDVVTPKASTMVAPETPVHLTSPPEPFVSRAGRKLDSAIEELGLQVADMRAIDVGASTGGFTDCLLQRGARSVVAVDVGYGQIHSRIRGDARVTVVERTNIRHADPGGLGAPFDLVVADLSFIGLETVAPQLTALGGDATIWLLLVKPQFEAGREFVGAGGIVVDPAVHRAVLHRVLGTFGRLGLGCRWLGVSSITGAAGNVEFLAQLQHGEATVSSADIDEITGTGPP